VKRAVLGPFDWPQVTQAGARGAALLAGIAAGRYGGIDELPGSPCTRIGNGPDRGGDVPEPAGRRRPQA
jgi:hypothetical protein